MANIRYIGAEASTEAFGKTFLASEWTDESGLEDGGLETLRTNPQFAVTDDKVAKAVKADPVVEVAASDPVAEPVAPDPAPVA